MVQNDSTVFLDEVLNLDLFKKSYLLTKGKIDSKVVSSVNVMLDREIVHWIEREGQVILTTGEMFGKLDEESLTSLIEALHEKKVSAVFIKVLPYIKQMPEVAMRKFEELNIPVLHLDYYVSFTEIFASIYALMYQKQTNILNRVETLHKDMMNVVVNGGNIDDILKSIFKTISVPVFIRDYYFEDTYYLKEVFQEEYEKLSDNIETTPFDHKQPQKTTEMIIYKEEEIERLLIPIFVKNKVYGHIAAYGKRGSIANYDQLGLEAISNVVALEFLKKISVQEVENKYKVEFFDDLISGDNQKRLKAVGRGSNFRFSENAFYALIHVHVHSETQDLIDRMMKASYLTDLICKDKGHSYMILNKSDGVYVMVMLKENEGKSIIQRYVKSIYDVLHSKMKKAQVKIGVGKVYQGLEYIYKSYTEAQKAVNASLKYMDQAVVFFDEMGVYKIFSNPSIQDEMQAFLNEMLDPLFVYDARKDTELVKTLEVYFQCNGNLKKMSECLFTHYNTILYRLSRIQEIIKVNLDDEDQRYALQTALKINHMR